MATSSGVHFCKAYLLDGIIGEEIAVCRPEALRRSGVSHQLPEEAIISFYLHIDMQKSNFLFVLHRLLLFLT